ncbi:hypothetical protein ABW19_dt0203833 [Dactylella cylindrospora]|nr:hypothetical protein ABW19_dt0203833 [Dactylella cylindrospora]
MVAGKVSQTLSPLDNFLRVVNNVKASEATEILIGKVSEVQNLVTDVRTLGRELVAAQPRELVIGNIVRRVLGVIREEAGEVTTPGLADITLSGRASRASSVGDESSAFDSTGNSGTATPASGRPFSSRGEDDIDELSRRKYSKVYIPNFTRTMVRSTTFQTQPNLFNTQYNTNNLQHSMFSLLSTSSLPADSPLGQTPTLRPDGKDVFDDRDLRGDVIEGIKEIMDELSQVDEQIAAHSESYIHANEIIMVHGSSVTVQRFLLKAATKRKFTVVIVESYPNDHVATHGMLAAPSKKPPPPPPTKGSKSPTAIQPQDEPLPTTEFKKTLTTMGVEVILIPDAAVFAIMSRVNKVILGTHVVMANGSLVAAGGARMIARCAQEHSNPVVVVTGVYKLSPVHPFDIEQLLEIGGSSSVVGWTDGEMVSGTEVFNPTMDFVPENLISLYITNVGGHAPSYLYKLVEEQYGNVEDNLE